MSEPNKEVIRRALIEAWGGGNFEVLEASVADGYIGHQGSQTETVRGRDALKEMMMAFRTAIPDLVYEVDDQLAEGEKVATRWRASGTHKGELFGVPATGRRIRFSGISIEHLADGKVIEDWSYWDALGLLKQIEAPDDR